MNHQFEIVEIYADWVLIKQGKIWEFFFWLFSVHCFYLDVLGKRHHLKQLEKSLQNIIKNQKVITKNQKVTERLIWKIATSEVQDWKWEDYEWLGSPTPLSSCWWLHSGVDESVQENQYIEFGESWYTTWLTPDGSNVPVMVWLPLDAV